FTTPGVYKMAGELTGVSPLKIQHVVQNGLSWQLDYMIRLMDPGEGRRIEEKADTPMFGKLLTRTPKGWYSYSAKRVGELETEYIGLKSKIESLANNPLADPEEVRAIANRYNRLAL